MPNQRIPNHWKGENFLYCAGFGKQGLLGISSDAQKIASDINLALGVKTMEWWDEDRNTIICNVKHTIMYGNFFLFFHLSFCNTEESKLKV